MDQFLTARKQLKPRKNPSLGGTSSRYGAPTGIDNKHVQKVMTGGMSPLDNHPVRIPTNWKGGKHRSQRGGMRIGKPKRIAVMSGGKHKQKGKGMLSFLPSWLNWADL